MNKIVKLQVNLPMHTELYIVGEVPCVITQKGNCCKELVITRIEDESIEFEDSIFSQYWIYAKKGNGEEKLYRAIENSPVTVEYEVK